MCALLSFLAVELYERYLINWRGDVRVNRWNVCEREDALVS